MSKIELKPGPYLSPIECAKRGDPLPLVIRIENGSASAEERKAAADIIKDRFGLRESPSHGPIEDRFKFTHQAYDEYLTLKRRVLAARYDQLLTEALRENPKPRKLWRRVQEELGRGRSVILAAHEKYIESDTDPECKKGILTTPWNSPYFEPVLTRL